ncbi:MAG: diadenylate cyclase CdaA [Sedimentisphaerales bacterium]|nr:diadenylate cyclase CdaA [Sedimentisphaerales bacterium]
MQTLIEYLRRVGSYEWWTVAVEFLLIGVVVYWAVDFLEGTRGERLFRGVVLLLFAGVLILNLISERYRFERLEYLYKGFLVGVLIIAVAAFQPEIRRALMRLGQPTFLIGSSRQVVKTAEEIVGAVTELAGSKTGAIIVIERRVALGEFIETGVRLDSNVSAELLKTIFYPGTALHDMAAVIRGDRIVAASVQLPLAEPGSVDGVQLGSRHRAAIGITAGSDAVCVVVSEETGIISVASEGKLTRNIKTEELRDILANAMGASGPSGRGMIR